MFPNITIISTYLFGKFKKETRYDNYFEKVVINEFKNEPVQHEPVHAVQKSKNEKDFFFEKKSYIFGIFQNFAPKSVILVNFEAVFATFYKKTRLNRFSAANRFVPHWFI